MGNGKWESNVILGQHWAVLSAPGQKGSKSEIVKTKPWAMGNMKLGNYKVGVKRHTQVAGPQHMLLPLITISKLL